MAKSVGWALWWNTFGMPNCDTRTCSGQRAKTVMPQQLSSASMGGLLHALPAAVVFPAVIEAADGVALDPAGGKLCPAVDAARVEEVDAAFGPPIQRVVDIHDPDRLRLARGKVGRVVHRLPEAPHVLAGEGARPGVLEVEPALAFSRHSALIPALSMTEPHCLLSALIKRANSSAPFGAGSICT